MEKTIYTRNADSSDDEEIDYVDIKYLKLFNDFTKYIDNSTRKLEPDAERIVMTIKGHCLIKYKHVFKFNINNRSLEDKRICEFKKSFNPKLSEPLIIAIMIEKKQIYILDGQHRFSAIFEKGCELIRNFNIVIDIRYIKSQYEYREHFRAVNNRYYTKDKQNLHKDKFELVKIYLNKTFSSKFKKNTIFAINRPSIRNTTFEDKLLKTKYFLSNKTTAEDIVNLLLRINRLFQQYDDYLIKSNIKYNKSTFNKCVDRNCFLGYDGQCKYIKLLDVDRMEWDSEFKDIYKI